ncbi:hypothetical protein SESBI_46535 [Sesbania bispinosa]|nr:hypothetical protein SESBI_46535 [Sesbania bispinosa]
MVALEFDRYRRCSLHTCTAVGSHQRDTPPGLHISLGRLSTQGSPHRSITNFSFELVT